MTLCTVPHPGLLLLSADLAQVPELIEAVAADVPSDDVEAAAETWLFLALAWLFEHRGDFLEPLEVIEELNADFGYPDEISGLVRFMPPPPGAGTGHRAIEQRWAEYLKVKGDALQARIIT